MELTYYDLWMISRTTSSFARAKSIAHLLVDYTYEMPTAEKMYQAEVTGADTLCFYIDLWKDNFLIQRKMRIVYMVILKL